MKPKIFLPILDNGSGSVKAEYMQSVLSAFGGGGYDVFIKRATDSHPDRGMNKITADFLESDCDEMLVIDCDIVFGRQQIDFLFEHDLPLVYGAYPKRQSDHALCLCTLDDFVPDPSAALIEVRRAGRGFMRVHRSVFDKMRFWIAESEPVAGSEGRYRFKMTDGENSSWHGGYAHEYHNHGRSEWCFWESGVADHQFSQLPIEQSEWLSEDWMFCERARALGFKIMVDQRIQLGHIGDVKFPLPGRG